MEYMTLKLKQVNKALDEVLLVSIAFAPIKIFINASKTPLRFVLLFLLRHVVLKFIFSEVETYSSSSISQPSLAKENIGSLTGSEGVFELNKYMNWKLKSVNKALDQAVPLKHPKKIREAMRHSLLLGGKRVCPILCIASCQLVGGDEALAMPMACAIEIIHTSWLIIEDLPCMEKVFGQKVAILASAALFSIAFEHIAENSTHAPPDRVVRAITELVSTIGTDRLVGGQFGELMTEGKNLTFKDVKYIHGHKTARLLEASIACGAIIGGATESDVQKIRKYARCIGLLCQVEDDLSNVTASAQHLGKFSNKDWMSDKTIFLNLMGIDNATKLARRLMTQAIQELNHFDARRAAPLHHLAYYIANSQH
ncbi:geranylgeranyl pyrophosphate synthase 7 chloroplastic-like [Tripterygium wilfordii]|uniref:Geranylgeranyl pyrophosphate synthase 7 chloroplastic-like n=2 Tax=Tripterygium wilfordii TaxID=458696 RepID=A0A7J7DMG4_TRIWF|nr:geranylgeranyl pyrophosphate synthase 7 chloroplastic-like [Tripterygium wilfordii]